MIRGELYRVRRPHGDPKRSRVFVVVSRQAVIGTQLPTLICAPVHSTGIGLATQVSVGPSEGLKHESFIQCDQLTSVQRAVLTDYVGVLPPTKMRRLDKALLVALDLDRALEVDLDSV